MGTFTLLKQGNLSNCLKNLTIKLGGFCMLELEENIKILFHGKISCPFIVLKQGNLFIYYKNLTIPFLLCSVC